MITVAITNSSPHGSYIHDPEDTSMYWSLPAGDTTTLSLGQDLFDRLHTTFTELRAKTNDDGSASFIIDTKLSDTQANVDFVGASGDVTRWIGNHVGSGAKVTNPTTPSAVDARRVDIAAGEAYVDGKFFEVSASGDETGDAEIDKGGADVSGVDLGTDEDVYMHVLLVNNAGSLETVFVRGDAVDNTGSLVPDELTVDELAGAVAEHLGESSPNYSFVQIAKVLFEESSGLSQTTTNYRPVPPSYG